MNVKDQLYEAFAHGWSMMRHLPRGNYILCVGKTADSNMADDKPVHIPKTRYPELTYPEIRLSPTVLEHHGSSDLHLRDYWRVIVARRWTIYAILATTVLITMIGTYKQTPIYRATATIQIDRENANVLNFKDVYEIQTQTDDTLQTQYKVLASSRSLARRVIENLKLNEAEEFGDTSAGFFQTYIKEVEAFLRPPSVESTREADPLRRVINEYLDRLEVVPVRQARLVNVSFESKDPTLAARVLNEHATQFIEQNLQYRYDATQDASAFLAQRLEGLKATLEKSEDRLQEYSQQNQILFTEEGRNTATEKLRQLEEEYTKAQAERFQKESLAKIARTGGADVVPQTSANSLLITLSARLAELQREESELAVTFGPEYPSRKRIRGQIEEIQRTVDSEKKKLLLSVEADYRASVERENLLSTELEKQRDLVNRINLDIIQYNILKREVESNKQLYEGILTRLKEAGVSAGLRASNIRIVDRAEVPSNPVKPRKSLNLFLSLFGGLVTGVGLAFFQEYMDNSIKSAEDITRFFKLPTLGMIPKLQSLSGKRKYGYGYRHIQALEKSDQPRTIDLIAHKSPNSLMAEAYRSVRTSLLLSAPDHPPKSIVITSALPSEGKTATAVNTAVSLTQTGSRVILIDADMRKPRLHQIFGTNGGAGLSNFLSGSASLKEVIRETAVPNLFVVPCGAVPPNPAELILSDRLRRMIEALSQYFDFVILDSPPLLNVSDARILSTACEASILVVKAFSTSRHLVKRALEDISGSTARLAGTVLNDIDVRSNSGYYPYSSTYSYYSRYTAQSGRSS